MVMSKIYEKSDWLESLVVVLRKQLIEGTVKPVEYRGLLGEDVLVHLMGAKESSSSTAGPDACRSDAWISREIKHCALQILATLLNPSSSSSGPSDSSGSCEFTLISPLFVVNKYFRLSSLK